jgi:hypothetical protein
VTPLTLFDVLVDGEFAFALRTGEVSASRVIHPRIDPNLLDGEIDSTDISRSDETQHLTALLGILHGINHARDCPASNYLPTKNPEAPKNGIAIPPRMDDGGNDWPKVNLTIEAVPSDPCAGLGRKNLNKYASAQRIDRERRRVQNISGYSLGIVDT